MPLNTDLSVAPFFDDFNANNQYYRVLFKPQVAVQARELNTVQSILQDQIEKFGNWAFKSGEIVSGCTITDDPLVNFVRLQDFQTNSASFDVLSLANLQVVSAVSNLTATIVFANSGSVSNYPNTNILYLSYKNTGNNGAVVFANNETLNFYSIPSTGTPVATINTFANSISSPVTSGNAHGIHVSTGVIYINGEFVQITTPTYGVVNNFGTYAGNNVVGFQLTETVITENQDPSLNDNALGYSNENAPGAWRMKLVPQLISFDPSSVTANNFATIAVYNYGSLVSTSTPKNNIYSIVGDQIAQRIYDEAGNYVVNPFNVDTVTSVTANSVVSSLDANSVLARVSTGVGYAQGQRVELQQTAYINMRRGIDIQTNLQQQITFNYGGYFVLDEVAGDFPFFSAQQVSFYDAEQTAVTSRKYSSLTPTGNLIGTAYARCFSYLSGTVGSNTAQYALHVFNVQMNSGYNTTNIQSVYFNNSTKAFGDLAIPDIQQSSKSNQLYSFGITGLKNLKSTNQIDNNTQYLYRTTQSYAVNSTQLSTYSVGNPSSVTVTLTGSAAHGTDNLPYGTGILTDINSATFSLVPTANVDSSNLTSTVSVNTTSNVITGSSTTFLTNYNVGDIIKVFEAGATSEQRTITAITNNTSMSVDGTFSTLNTAANYCKSYIAGKFINISQSTSGPKTYVNVINTTAFSIVTGEIPSASVPVDVTFNVLRKAVSPASKVINKYRFVKLDTRISPNGPWCLGIADIHRVRAVYGSSDGSYSISNPIITTNFVFGTGQKDTHYDMAYLYPVPGYSTASTPYLLIELDYFTANTSSGVGFFTVESYPIDDANTANNNAIQTSHLPLYVDKSGNKITLRDYVDFRPFPYNVANNTGNCDISNTTQVTAAISYATTILGNNYITATSNTSTNLVFQVPSTGLNVPAYGGNFQSDYNFYLPRKDLIMITPDNLLKIKEGVSSTAPQPPLYPDNAMVLSVINVPAYPSLSTDQRDSLLSINQSSKDLVRDTSTAISTNLVTNRRYTMKDIGTLDNRITNLEYYQSLSLLEKKATDMTITDANGLNRFKNGIFVEGFTDFTQSQVSNPEYTLAIDTSNAIGRPRIIREIINIEFDLNDSTTVQQTGRLVTLPYTQKSFLVQPYATAYRSAAHVSMAWNGNVVLVPPYDNHNDINNTGSINITVDLATPWQEFANSPLGSIWGDWQTTTSTTSTTIYDQPAGGTGSYLPVVDIGFIGGAIGWSQATANAVALQKIQAIYGQNVTVGAFNILHTGTYSDARLKRNISLIGKLLNGLNLYRFRYIWSDIVYVGVMAQEVIKIIPDAIAYNKNGYMSVDYTKVGVPFLTFDQWLNTNGK